MDFTNRILHDWLVLFSMVNAVGNLPLFADLTSAMDARQRSQAFRTAILTAASVVLTFAFFGSWMLKVAFEVDTNAFKVAGGILVFIAYIFVASKAVAFVLSGLAAYFAGHLPQ